MKRTSILCCLLPVLLAAPEACGQTPLQWENGWTVRYSGMHGQIEAGGPLAGVECHDGRPLPSRISLYAPVANSIDLSADYWKRGDSRPVVVGIRVDDQPKRWIGKEPWAYALSPHTVAFERAEGDLRYTVRHDFGTHTVAAAMTITVRNAGNHAHEIELYTHTLLALRSCQTYTRFGTAYTRYDAKQHAVIAAFGEPQIARAAVIVQNAGLVPVGWTTNADELAVADSGWSNWIERDTPLRNGVSVKDQHLPAVAAFQYRFRLVPGDSVQIVQIMSSVVRTAVARTIAENARHWKNDIAAYGKPVQQAAAGDAVFRTGDAWTDNSVHYARALLAANRHVLNGTVVPMPCPAEYNFFFTHDALLTNLSAIVYDPARVRRDLLYIAKHAKDGIIPHAYYWKDDGFKTEYCAAGNWNNVWFILASASYLRHTDDSVTVRKLLPLLRKSLEQTVSRRKGNIMHGTEPDWWDFGHAEGGRAYLTILTIRALEEYVYLGARMRSDLPRLAVFEASAAELRSGLLQNLWSEEAGTLLNTIGDVQDRHVYMGPLLAPVYGALPRSYGRRIVETVRRHLLDPEIGVRTVAPADFHTDSVKAQYKVKGNEAGDAYWYANGGIWYLGNAWYAAALQAIGEHDSALAFYRRTMTLDGITQSPQGQPALHEYRYADPASPRRGLVDKPTMMWAAGFCIGTAYRLAGFQDNAWNVTVAGGAPGSFRDITATYVFGTSKQITRTGTGSMLTRLQADGRDIPSRILPLDAAAARTISIAMGPICYPFLDSLNAVLHAASVDPQERKMTCTVSSYPGHVTEMKIITPWMAESVLVNGKPWHAWRVTSTPQGTLVVTVTYPASAGNDRVDIHYGGR